jgi:ABC-type Fe3+/spermidine/putrescine transport system ATPase subunit
VPGTYQGTDDGHAVVAFKDAALGRARLPADGRTLAAGDAVLVTVRPERLRLSTSNAESNFAGTVTDCTFLGRHTRYRIQALGQMLAVSVTEWSPAAALAFGTPVSLGWAAEDAQILGGQDGMPALPLEIMR